MAVKDAISWGRISQAQGNGCDAIVQQLHPSGAMLAEPTFRKSHWFKVDECNATK
jgi:hypothetical protein